MPHLRFLPRKSLRLRLISAFPLGLIVLPLAVLVNLWLYLGNAALNQNAFYLLFGVTVLGLSLSALTLPEILRGTNTKMAGLATWLVLLIVVTSLIGAIGVQLFRQLDLQTLMLLAVLAGVVGLIVTVKSWVGWTFK
jgi:hypothetical protein